MSVEISPPFRVFTDVDGEPLEDGYIYIGAVNQNPQAVPISVFWDSALTIPAAQPIRTLGGYPSRTGTPSRMYVAGDAYSISVLNKNSTLIYSDLDNRAGDAGLRQDLADDTDPALGAGIPAFNPSLPYSAGSAGAFLNSLSGVASFVFPERFGVLTLEQGATDPVDTAAKFELMRLYAEANSSYVFVPAGTYVMPQGVRLDADNTVWHFAPGAIIKLWDTQATDDFTLYQSPVNQRVRGLRVDGNRVNQVSATFGIDNCACIVVDATGCVFEDTGIISSPAKGFAIVSSAAGTNSDVEIRGFAGADCNNQCLMVDGNNMTGFFKRIVIDGVRIGETSHAGVALNDGAHNIALSNVIADVNNVIWDAVFIRDSWDIQLNNIRGSRGRNGVQIQRLNGFCGRIELNNVIGELSDQSGVLLLGAENITGGVVVGRNNGIVGINIAATGGGDRCKNVNISAPSGYDDRGVPAQQFGILAQGLDVGRLGRHIAYGNTTKDISIIRASTADVEADIYRVSSITTGSIAALSQAAITVTFATPLEDAVYDITAYVSVGTTGRSLAIGHISAQTAGAVQVLVHNIHATVAQDGTLTVKAVRRP